MEKITQKKDVKRFFDVPDEAIAFLEGLHSDVACGKYEFGEDCYVNVMDCETSTSFAHIEAHRTYIDVQVLIDGEERIYYADVENLNPETLYDAEKDVAFYDYAEGSPFVDYTRGEAVILYPRDGHLPCRAVNQPMRVKKAVMKVRYKS